ncbi:hypothetical protein [Pantoea sp.]|uniref:hypothetical protein n=1 Tax=Pantoea sp. TaxID=69393 RepID=UPI0031D63C7D
MTKIVEQIKSYVEDAVGLKASTRKLAALPLPFFIEDMYQLIGMRLTLTEQHIFDVLLIVQKEEAYPGIVALRKHLNQIHKVTNEPLVYVNHALSAADRKSLVTHHINFIQPHTQLFIPELALDIREAYRQHRISKEFDTLFPATQAVLIACLNRSWSLSQAYTSSQLAQGVDYSRVTLSKVIDQMLALDILTRGEKARTYHFTASKKDVYEKILPLMRSPVKRAVAINITLTTGEDIFWAGETALAQYSLLVEPVKPIYGMTQECFSNMLKQNELRETESIDETRAMVELWTYPNPIKEKQIADPLSLFLSLKDNKDERIQIALDEMMGEMAWLK